MSYALQDDQAEAFDSVMEFMFDSQDTKCISGGSGTGKSVLITYIVENLLTKCEDICKLMGLPVQIKKIVVLATTNSAANELESKLTANLPQSFVNLLHTGHRPILPVRTVHSYFNFKVEDDYATGNTGVAKLVDDIPIFVLENTLVIIDEASQLDGVIKRMVMKHLSTTSKLLLVGDKRQLLPVKGSMTTAFHQPNTYCLTTTRRTSHPALQALYAQLEQGVDTQSFSKITLAPGVIDWLSEDEAQTEITEAFRTAADTAKVATYTDARSRETNSFIRHIQGRPAEISVGDKLVVNNSGVNRFPVGTQVEVQYLGNVQDKYFQDTKPIDEGGAVIMVPYMNARIVAGKYQRDVSIPVDINHYFATIKYFAATKNWKSYFALKKEFLDLRLPYAMTTYKLQGITVPTIFVDMTDLCSCKNRDTLARLLYVAMTRASQRVVLYGSIPLRYRSLVEEVICSPKV